MQHNRAVASHRQDCGHEYRSTTTKHTRFDQVSLNVARQQPLDAALQVCESSQREARVRRRELSGEAPSDGEPEGTVCQGVRVDTSRVLAIFAVDGA